MILAVRIPRKAGLFIWREDKVKPTSIDVREEDEGDFVEGEQGVQHQPVDLYGVLDVSSNRVLQSHDVVMFLHFVT